MIRLYNLCSLIFFVVIFLSCRQNEQKEISLVWNNTSAVAISIPKALLVDHDGTLNKDLLEVRVEKSLTAMLGDFEIKDGEVIFTPVVPLSRGLGYELFFDNRKIGAIKVPSADPADAPEVVTVYPTADTLPENLLKMYLQFSRPMREGESQKNITLLNQNMDTVKGVFLDLQPELWNKERTVLTIWLDPGRIKRELIPNQQLGNPLKKDGHYTLGISDNWKDVQSLSLKHAYTKQFFVGVRDSTSPDPAKWKLTLPPANTTQPVDINFDEPLDNFLLQESIRVVDENNKIVSGRLKVADKEKKMSFMPNSKWLPGPYRLQIEAILEDVAGNNLNRPFDRDITVKNEKADKRVYERIFDIRN